MQDCTTFSYTNIAITSVCNVHFHVLIDIFTADNKAMQT